MKQKILVAMSGGVDSSAVCLMLQEQGYEVVGFTMRVFDLPRQFGEGDDQPDFVRSAQALARRLGIEHHVADVRGEFRDEVVRYFLDEYEQGRTPNPCVRCNRQFKFRLMEEWADRLGCSQMATGHYVRLRHDAQGRAFLLTGQDPRKDQSYFLWQVPQRILRRCVFPLGDLCKQDVRRYLDGKGFEVQARQGESMEVCFVEGDYRDFLRAQRPELVQRVAGGTYVNRLGQPLGHHLGVPFYTVGQRKGLGIALGHPAYVVRLNAAKNTIVLGEEGDLLTSAFFVEELRAVDEALLMEEPQLAVRIRYHSEPEACRLERLSDGRFLVRTARPVSAVTPGQSAVFYAGQVLLAGAVIASQKGIGQYV